MNIEVKLFFNFSQYLPPGSKEGKVSLSIDEGLTIEGLMERLGISPELPRMIVLNGIIEQNSHRNLKEGDVVAVFPPLFGG